MHFEHAMGTALASTFDSGQQCPLEIQAAMAME
jgi:hypothetical protein